MNLKISAWGAIASAILVFPATLFGLLLAGIPESNVVFILWLVVMALTTIAYVPIFIGYLRIAKLNKLQFLSVMLWINFVVLIVFNVFAVITEIIGTASSLWNLIPLVVVGIALFITGIAILKLHHIFKGIATAVGVLYIINGVFFVSVLLVFLFPLTALVVSILEAILFFKASAKYD